MNNRKAAILVILMPLLAYLIIISVHYIFGFNARDVHNVGVMAGAVVFFIAFAIMANKNKWVGNLESLE